MSAPLLDLYANALATMSRPERSAFDSYVVGALLTHVAFEDGCDILTRGAAFATEPAK